MNRAVIIIAVTLLLADLLRKHLKLGNEGKETAAYDFEVPLG